MPVADFDVHAAAELHVAAALLQDGRVADALARLDALRAHGRADARHHLLAGQALQRLDRHLDALAAYERALERDSALGLAWTLRGQILRRSGRVADAAFCFRRALACGEAAAPLRWFLSAVGIGEVPRVPPPGYVRELFDDYAEGFEDHLVQTLRYRGHEVLVQGLAAIGRGAFADALDLGCGTGLAAPLLRPLARRLTGVDLSARMLAAAGRTGFYDELVRQDLVEHLAATGRRHDLVVCGDVFIYVGELTPVFEGLRRVVAPDGIVAFSVESCQARAGFDLLATLRYAHAEPYLRRLAAAHGFEVARAERGDLRTGADGPIEGLFMHLRRTGG